MKDRKKLLQESQTLEGKVRNLTAALDGLPSNATPERALLVADLARAQGERRDLEETLQTASIPRLFSTSPKKTPRAGLTTPQLPAVVPTAPVVASSVALPTQKPLPSQVNPVKAQPPATTKPTEGTKGGPPPSAYRPISFPAALESVDPGVPLVLFPIRLEVRFTEAHLLIRIYPDEILADSHEPELTTSERAAAARFWKVTRLSSGGPLKAWRELLLSVRPERAAWITRVTDPERPVPVGARQHTWTRAVQAWILPDRWCARVIRFEGEAIHARERGGYESNPVQRPLALTISPVGTPDPTCAPYDADSKWLVDFASAEEVGMAIRIPLTAEDHLYGFDRLYVAGIYSQTDPEDGARAMARLLDAHHYTRGLAFVRQGTPTNNSTGTPAGYPPSADPDSLYQIERVAARVPEGSDADALGDALGMDHSVFYHVAGSDGQEQLRAEVMNRSLYPSTIGYLMTNILAPVVEAPDAEAVRTHFIRFVRGRGPLPAIRIGSVPYGFLVASSIRRWVASEGRPIDKLIPPNLKALREALRTRLRSSEVGNLPRVGRTPADPNLDLLQILGGDSRLRELRVRRGMGPEAVVAYLRSLNFSDEVLRHTESWYARQTAQLGSRVDRASRLIFDEHAGHFMGALVTSEALSEAAPSSGSPLRAWLRRLARASLQELRDGLPEVGSPPPLLYGLLRHAAVWELARIASEAGVDLPIFPEPEVISPTKRSGGRTVWTALEAATQAGALAEEAIKRGMSEWRTSVESLAEASSAELERLLTETLDVCSHRIDAWETSLYTERLARMRQARPRGCHLGAWGVLENIRRRHPEAPRSLGYVHAPSLDHAATAAVLLNAHHTWRGEQAARYRIDLSSARVRGALWVLDAIRSGQRFEDALARISGRDATRDAAIRDALGDLFTAEAVYQIVRGNASVAAASLDALARGLRPPEPEVIRSARGGPSVTHRVLLALTGAAAGAGGWSAPLTPRARLSPVLDAWVGERLGDPTKVYCWAQYELGGARQQTLLSLASLRLRPMDVLALATERPVGFSSESQPTPDAFSTELELRLWRLLPPGATEVMFEFHLEGGEGTEFPVVFEVARAVEALFGTARPLRPNDLVLPEQASTTPVALGAVQLELRGLVAELAELWKTLQEASGTELSEALLRATLFDLPEALWLPKDAATTTLETRARSVAASILARLRRAAYPANSPEAPPANLDDAELLVSCTGRVQSRITHAAPEVIEALFGRKRLVLPALSPLTLRTRDSGPESSRLPVSLSVPPTELRRWMQRMWQVRAPLEVWRRVALYDGVLHGGRAQPTVMQLEPAPFGRWVGGTFEARWNAKEFLGYELPPSGCVSLCCIQGGDALQATWYGLLLDEWTEMIPNDRELTGIALQYDDPGAEAAQVVLVAVPPVVGERWSEDSLFAVIEDTFELSQIRTMDASALGDRGRFLPALYVAANTSEDTVSTRFDRLQADPPSPSGNAS